MGKLLSPLVNKSSYVDPEAILASIIEALVASPEKDVSLSFGQEPERRWRGAGRPQVVTLSKLILDRLQNAQENAPCGQICSIAPQLLHTLGRLLVGGGF